MNNLIQTITVYALPMLLAITLHEAAHAYVARLFGDMTATRAGRVSLNPARHIDPVGTVLVPVALLLMSKTLSGTGLLFGWAKPVPVNFAQLRHPKRDMLWVALAGPMANLAMAILWALALRLCAELEMTSSDFWVRVAVAGINVNLGLMALNLLPLPPLDGGRIVFSLLPNPIAWRYARIEPYGMLIILLLLATGLLGALMEPLIALGGVMVRLVL